MARNGRVTFVVFLVCGLIGYTMASSSSPIVSSSDCVYWRGKVDPELELQGPMIELPTDDDALKVIACLLECQGQTADGRFGGATSFEVSMVADLPSIEVCALYYISFIFEKDWKHASLVALVDEEGELNTNAAVDSAFSAAQDWYEMARSVGIEAARQAGDGPIDGSSVQWYGKLPRGNPDSEQDEIH